jgi:REP element-mobilizing transposase RayT
MSHSFTNVWIHIIFSTKDRLPLIQNSFEKQLFDRLRNKLISDFESHASAVNGIDNHIHILFKQSPNFSIKDIVKNLKGESSHWINENDFIKSKFVWQPGYAAFSISIDKVDTIKKYIDNQKEHHKKLSYADEVKKFLEIYGFNKNL